MFSNSEGKMFSNSEFYTQPANQLSINEEQRHFQVLTACIPFSRKLLVGGGLVAKSCPTLPTPMDCNLPGSSVHGILQARMLEWVAISFSRGSSLPKNWTQVSCIAGRWFPNWAMREAQTTGGCVLMKGESLSKRGKHRIQRTGDATQGTWRECPGGKWDRPGWCAQVQLDRSSRGDASDAP